MAGYSLPMKNSLLLLFMKKVIFLFLFAVTVLACQTKAEDRKDGFTVTGKVKTPQKGKVILHILGKQGFQPVDSVALAKDNTYTIKGKTAEPRFYMLDFYDVQKVLVILNNGDNITVDVDGNNPNGAFTMKGSAEVEQLEKVVKVQNNFQAKAAALQADFQKAAAKKDDKAKSAIQSKYFAMQKEQNEDLKKLIKAGGPTLASWYATNALNPEEEYAFLAPLAPAFEKAFPNSEYIKDFSAKIAQYKNAIQVGQQAPDITLNSPEGKAVSLSSLRGKYVLIDFWASWCGPCRQENPNVVKMYNRFKGKNFEIFGVSLDKEKDKWIQAIANDGLTWVHVSDLKFWNSAGAEAYGVRSIPATFLVDPQGVIVAKNLRGKELEDKLAQILRQ
jgi:peroxiredoxin